MDIPGNGQGALGQGRVGRTFLKLRKQPIGFCHGIFNHGGVFVHPNDLGIQFGNQENQPLIPVGMLCADEQELVLTQAGDHGPQNNGSGQGHQENVDLQRQCEGIGLQPAEQFRSIGHIDHKEQRNVTMPVGQLEVMPAEIKMKQTSVDIIENQLRKKVHQSMGCKAILYRVDQHTGQIDAGACKQHGGYDRNLLVKKDQNGQEQNAHGYPEIGGEDIQIDLGEQDDENTEREGLFSF